MGRGSAALHVLLLVAELALALGTVAFYGRLADRFASRAESGQAWARRIGRYAVLSELGHEVARGVRHAVGRPAEARRSARLEAALGRFGEQLERARAELGGGGPEGLPARIEEVGLRVAEVAKKAWISAAESAIGTDAERRASGRDAERATRSLEAALGELVQAARADQRTALAEAARDAAAAARRGEWLRLLAWVLVALGALHGLVLFRGLRRARRELEEARRGERFFLRNMSYAIRTPMNSIIGMTDLVLETKLTRDQKASLEVVRSSAESLLATLNNVLDHAKLHAGGLVLDDDAFDVRGVVYAALRSLAPRAYEKGLELIWLVAPDVPETVRGDGAHVQQMVHNLADNAITFTDDGEVVVRVRREAASDEAIVLSFDVEDTGIGIAPDRLPDLLDGDAVVRADRERPVGGVGLGLPVCARLAREMGGDIEVQSEPGRGSTFRIHLPFRRDEGRKAEPAGRNAGDLRDVRVLVVEDNAAVRRVVTGMLRAFRAVAVPASSNGEALALLREARTDGRPFDVVVFDAEMVDAGAPPLAVRIRGEEGGSRVGLVATAAWVRECGDASDGADAVVAKPIRPRDLLAAVRDALSRGGRPAGRPPAAAGMCSLRVLLADDNRIDRTLTVRLLEKRGHQVTAVESGEAALEAFAVEVFDVVLMDVQMPGMGGLQATRAIRERERKTGGHVPIVALTAHDMKGRCLEAGMDAYVTKPVDAQEVAEVIGRLVPAGDEAGEEGVCALDEGVALERAGGDRSLLVDLAEMCLSDGPAALERIRQALAGGDSRGVERAAHKLKGSLLVLAADPASEAAYRVEALGAQGALDKAAEALSALERELDRLRPTLDRIARSGEARAGSPA